MKKIIFTVTNDLVYDQRMSRICKSLSEAGYQVLLVGLLFSNSPQLSGVTYDHARINCWFKNGKLFYLEYNFRLFFFLLFQKADCYCAIDLDTILPCYLVSVLKMKKRVYDAHEYFSQLNEVVSRPGIYRLWHWVEKKMIPRFANGYTVCESIAGEFRKLYNVEYSVIRSVPILVQQNEQATKKNVILYQGAVNKGRGLEKLVAAMKSVDAVLWVCGQGNFLSEMRKEVEKHKLADKIIFWGMLDPVSLRQKTAEAFIAVNPFQRNGLNQYWSLSNKFFDYIHAAVPQVTMNYPEYKKINEQYQVAVLIDDTETELLSVAINKLMSDRELYQSLKENCIKARQELNWQKEEKILLDFYRKLFHER